MRLFYLSLLILLPLTLNANSLVLKAQNIGFGLKEINVSKTYTGLVPGDDYNFSFQVLFINKPVIFTDGTGFSIVSSPGSQSLTFTASSSSPTITFYHLSFGFPARIEIDEVVLQKSEEVTSVSCLPLSDTDYRYAFNGIEKDDEVKYGKGNHYNFTARCYDPRLGRWLSLDPDAEIFPFISDYAAQLNNPLYYIDPNGRIVKPVGEKAQALWDKYYEGADEETKAQLDALKSSDVIYEINYEAVDPTSYEYGGHTHLKYLDDGEGNVVISMELNPSVNDSEDDRDNHALQVLADESTHAYQFETGEIGYEAGYDEDSKSYKSNVVGYDALDEIESKESAKKAIEKHGLTPISSNKAYIDAMEAGKSGEEFLKEYKRESDGASYKDLFTDEQWESQDPDQDQMNKDFKDWYTDGYVLRKEGETIKKSRGKAKKAEIK